MSQSLLEATAEELSLVLRSLSQSKFRLAEIQSSILAGWTRSPDSLEAYISLTRKPPSPLVPPGAVSGISAANLLDTLGAVERAESELMALLSGAYQYLKLSMAPPKPLSDMLTGK